MADQSQEKAIVIITGPYQLLQALWYCSEHPQYEYHAIIKNAQLSELVREQIKANCERSGFFRSISVSHGVNMDSGLLNQSLLMLKMCLYYLFGQRRRLTRQIIRREIGDEKYSLALVDSENSILSGAFIDHSDAGYRVVIMQEGVSDILERKSRPDRSAKQLAFYMVARMGYCNPGVYYKLRKTQFCTKLSSFPQRLLYRQFAAIEDIFQHEGNDTFKSAIQRVFPQLDWGLYQQADIILFTTVMDPLGGGDAEQKLLHDWLKEQLHGGKLLIKKHPREAYQYDWEDMDISFIDPGIPAELILSQSGRQRIVFSFVSTSIVEILGKETDYQVIRFDSIKGKYYNQVFPQLQKQLQLPEDRIVHLG
ncbi:MAG: polysialyltransferase family glycosyltransferase [Clostridia bacterium]|nr:polysialyltransferase family glycosyltransferase [Clostridia bacterium]